MCQSFSKATDRSLIVTSFHVLCFKQSKVLGDCCLQRFNMRLERQLGSSRHILLLQRTEVQFPALTTGSSQLTVIPVTEQSPSTLFLPSLTLISCTLGHTANTYIRHKHNSFVISVFKIGFPLLTKYFYWKVPGPFWSTLKTMDSEPHRELVSNLSHNTDFLKQCTLKWFWSYNEQSENNKHH